MENLRWLATCLAVALAGIIIWTEAGFAQGRGGGPRGQANQGYQGEQLTRGPNYQNCPNYPAYQYCPQNPQGQGNNPQGRRGPRRGGRAIQPTPQTNQTNPPEATQ